MTVAGPLDAVAWPVFTDVVVLVPEQVLVNLDGETKQVMGEDLVLREPGAIQERTSYPGLLCSADVKASVIASGGWLGIAVVWFVYFRESVPSLHLTRSAGCP